MNATTAIRSARSASASRTVTNGQLACITYDLTRGLKQVRLAAAKVGPSTSTKEVLARHRAVHVSPNIRPISTALALPSRRRDTTSTRSAKLSSSSKREIHHFDTHSFVRRLEHEGLNRQQAEGIMSAIESVIDESIRNMSAGMVTKAQQEKVCCVDFTRKLVFCPYQWMSALLISIICFTSIATLHSTSRLCPTQI